MPKHHHKMHRVHKTHRIKRSTSQNLIWGVYWFFVYGILIALFNFITNKYDILQHDVPHFLFLGLLMTLGGRLIYSATKSKTFRLKGFLVWTVIYGVLLFLISTILQEFKTLTNKWFILIITSIIFTSLAMFIRRANIKHERHRRKGIFSRAPSQIFTGIILLIMGILCWRFSYTVFITWFNWSEGLAWSILIGFGLVIAGILVLVAWWRNNVLQHRIGIKVGHWK